MVLDHEKYLSKKDPKIGQIISLVDSVSYKNTKDIFEDLVSCILDMRIHYTPTNASFRYPRLKKLMRDKPINPYFILNLPDEILSKLKLSHQKHNSLKILAEKWTSEKISEVDWKELNNDQVRERLIRDYAIGFIKCDETFENSLLVTILCCC